MDKITIEEYRKLTKPAKYGNRKVSIGGETFASQKEADRWCHLLLLEKAGEVVKLTPHPVYQLLVNGVRIGKFTADFEWVSKDGEVHIEDVKGGQATKTTAYRLRKRLFEACHFPLVVEEL